MTKEEFISKYPRIMQDTYYHDLKALIASELAKASRPKPPFEKPFKIIWQSDGPWVVDANYKGFGMKKVESAEYVCNALNKYEGE